MTSQSERRIRGRLLLLLPLAAWMAASFYLITAAPDDGSRSSYGAWLSGNQRYAVFYDEVAKTEPNRNTIDITTIDLESGEDASIEVPDGQMLVASADKDWNVYLVQRPVDEATGELRTDSTDLIFLDFLNHQVQTTRGVAFPEMDYARLVGERYLVGLSDGQVHVLDTHDVESGIKSTAAQPSTSYAWGLKESNRFLVGETLAPGPVTAKGVTATIELYEVEDDGKAKSISSWTAGVIDRWTDLACDEKHAYSLSPDLTKIEVRAVDDGALLSNFSLPGVPHFRGRNVSLVLLTVSVQSTDGEFEYFDLLTRQWLPKPEPGYRIFNISADRRYLHYSKRVGNQYETKVYDRQLDRYVSEYSMPRSGEAIKVDDQLIVLSRRYGYSVEFLDFATGKRVREITPLFWLVRWLIALMMLYAVWAFAWMVVSAREGGWAWTDVVLVVGMPLLVMILRTGLRGETLDLMRPPTRHALGGVMAAEMLAVTWIVFGNTRWSLRFVPLIVLTSLLMMLFTFVFGEKPWIVWHATKCALVPAIGLIVPLILLRLAGWRLSQDAGDAVSSLHGDAPIGRGKFPLRDLILITVVAAVWFAAARPVLEAVGEFFYVNTILLMPLAVAVACGLAAIMLGLSRRKVFLIIGFGLATVAVSYLAMEPLSQFAGSDYSARNIDRLQLQPPIACGAALLVGVMPYRMRGWRFGRGLGVSGQTP